jgi:hypothetical protein
VAVLSCAAAVVLTPMLEIVAIEEWRPKENVNVMVTQ